MTDSADEDGEQTVARSRWPTPFRDLCVRLSQEALWHRLFGSESPRVDRFEIRRVLGEGGFGCVFRAWDPKLDREVALKLCPVRSEFHAALLLSEARAVAGLSDANVITVHDCGRDGDLSFLVMEYVRGGTLHDYAVTGGPRPWQQIVEVFADAARGIAAAHRKDIIHGDIKPDNILLHEDLRPRVADFGLARFVGQPVLMPYAVGTVPFTAPELLAGQQERDKLTDQWSLFVSLCLCIDGKLPMIATDAPRLPSTDEEMLRCIEAWAGPSTLYTQLPAALVEVLSVGLSFDRRDRFPSMDAVADALEDVLADELIARAAEVRMDSVPEPKANPEPALVPTAFPSEDNMDTSADALADKPTTEVALGERGASADEQDTSTDEQDTAGAVDDDRAESAPEDEGSTAETEVVVVPTAPPSNDEAGPTLVIAPPGEGVVVRSPVGPPALSTSPPWWKRGLPALVLTMGVGLVLPAYWLGRHHATDEHHATREIVRPESELPVDVDEEEPADENQETEDPLCVVGDVPIEPDDGVRAMCRTLKADGHKAAIDLWEKFTKSREVDADDDQDWLKLGCDTTVLAQTILRDTKTATPELAVKLNESAVTLASAAKIYLKNVKGSETAEAVSLVKSSIASIGAGDEKPASTASSGSETGAD